MFRSLTVFLRLFGIDILRLVSSLVSIPWYIRQYFFFIRHQKDSFFPIDLYPILFDRFESASALGEYFWQDLFVAQKVLSLNPRKHVDIGSRIDGFVAHLACVRQVEVLDIRPLPVNINNVFFTQWDITEPNPAFFGIYDCVTCLHTLEHIGLGRYGDQLDPNGWSKGLASLSLLLQPQGVLLISVPIGVQRVQFNAHRIFHPSTIVKVASLNGLSLSNFHHLTHSGSFLEGDLGDFDFLAQQRYGLGIFCFTRS
ncbi:hypothetical protein SynPROS91_00185 [Synechococcus sp. PROS-9-1]|uniref:DUF268 domain-containing protein n=1 Tax=Synechococcus sp. PROS-9-1 TaxID=1968775 RepID=UPI0016480336|nr:DUF268 domain-containing protein [Synechococcus sp. PROS-9-1]QNJ30613.1 hypothetical protein SynPROS91_00185 [Synechococcus sp. PROS-9-1]